MLSAVSIKEWCINRDRFEEVRFHGQPVRNISTTLTQGRNRMCSIELQDGTRIEDMSIDEALEAEAVGDVKAESVTVYGAQIAVLLVVEMIEHGAAVTCEPLPNNAYAISVKPEAYNLLRRACDTLALPSPEECKGKLVVVLASCGNPDFRQYAPVSTPRMQIVGTLAEAQQVCSEYIADNELGAGNWAGGQVMRDGEVVAYVAYNGSVWDKMPGEEGGRRIKV